MDHLGVLIMIGFLLGLRHATDADHVVAMSTIISKTKRPGSAWLLGSFWGLGHLLTVLGVGIGILLFKVTISADMERMLEFSVGTLLVCLGGLNLAGVRWLKWPLSEHAHSHEHNEDHSHHLLEASPAGLEGSHAHSHAHSSALERLIREVGKAQMVKAFGIGMLHGLAGSAAIALLVLATVPHVWGGIFYLLVFGLGNLAGMLALSAVMEYSLLWVEKRYRLQDWLASGTGALSLLFGLYIMYQRGR